MNANIDNICNGLCNYAQSLKREVNIMIKNIIPQREALSISTSMANEKSSHVSNPERPWMVAGGTALAVGILGAILSGHSWSYIVGGMGIASIIYGQTKKKPQEITGVSPQRQSLSAPKGYEIAEKVIEVSKMVEEKWRAKVEECKGMVQRVIENSSASLEVKDSLMGQTYTTERITIDFDTIVSNIESQQASSYPSILSEYEKMINNCIDMAMADQIAVYKNISQKI